MFVVSQYILNLSGMCTTNQQITTYSIALGLILYGSIYLYILFYNNEYLNIFNKFIIYIIAVDLLLSAFYYYNLQSNDKLIQAKEDSEVDSEVESDDDEYESENESEDEMTTSKEDDTETQEYIKNLINQANVYKQSKEEEEIQTVTVNENQDVIPEAETEIEETEIEESHVDVDLDIDNIIEEVSIKKQRGRKKKNQPIVL